MGNAMATGGSPGPISSAGWQWCSRSFQVHKSSQVKCIYIAHLKTTRVDQGAVTQAVTHCT